MTDNAPAEPIELSEALLEKRTQWIDKVLKFMLPNGIYLMVKNTEKHIELAQYLADQQITMSFAPDGRAFITRGGKKFAEWKPPTIEISDTVLRDIPDFDALMLDPTQDLSNLLDPASLRQVQRDFDARQAAKFSRN